ncbi:MAG: type I 3-dehydroquinate dehydratase [Acidobacteria bacterium]|nr:MAG: type I 3-dehydroquinate dehydratase [Acidobacteriota bacterium]
MSQLCLTLAESEIDQLAAKIRRYDGACPLIEIRIDHLSTPQVPNLPDPKRSRYIGTCRPVREGGCYAGAETDRLGLLSRAAQSGYDWIDLERDVAEIRLPPGVQVVRSYHDFLGFPTDWPSLLEALDALPGDVTKVAAAVENTRQVAQLLRQLERPSSRKRILIGMGSFGQPSRLLGHFLGNAWTYVAEEPGRMVAPGQFSFPEAVNSFRLHFAGGRPTIYGVLGNPLAHSLSPPLHNRLFSHYGLANVYLPFRLTALEPWFDYVSRSPMKFGGFSVTLPFKTDAVEFVRDRREPDSALNTLIRDGSGWTGLNTDYAGFLKPLAELDLRGRHSLVIGAGGVVHTVVRALRDRGSRVTIVARDAAKATALAERYQCAIASFSDLPIAAHLCVNCTPVGQYPQTDLSPLSRNDLAFEIVYDLIYRPARTELLRMAEESGMKTISGIQMFVEQAALQFEAWTGIDPDRKLVREIVESLFFEASGPKDRE